MRWAFVKSRSWSMIRSLTLGCLLAAVAAPLVAKEPATKAPTTKKPSATEWSVGSRMIAMGQQMIGEFKTTRYSHKTMIDTERKICEVDCSGFIVTLLKQVSPPHLATIPTEHKRPLAEDFYDLFADRQKSLQAGWMPVTRVEEAIVGDVLAWKKLDRKEGENTGHVMLIAEKPQLESPGQYRIRVMDSTSSGHGDDPRVDGKNGIGQGTIYLVVDAGGRPTAYRWKSRTGTLHEAPIDIGRAVTAGLNY